MSYKIIKQKTLLALEEEVNKSINLGYIPQGGMAVDTVGEMFFVQTVYRPGSDRLGEIATKIDEVKAVAETIASNTTPEEG